MAGARAGLSRRSSIGRTENYTQDATEVLRVLLDEEKPFLEDPKTWKLGGEGWKEDGREPEHDLTDYMIII